MKTVFSTLAFVALFFITCLIVQAVMVFWIAATADASGWKMPLMVLLWFVGLAVAGGGMRNFFFLAYQYNPHGAVVFWFTLALVLFDGYARVESAWRSLSPVEGGSEWFALSAYILWMVCFASVCINSAAKFQYSQKYVKAKLLHNEQTGTF
jgi:hypothetical protein